MSGVLINSVGCWTDALVVLSSKVPFVYKKLDVDHLCDRYCNVSAPVLIYPGYSVVVDTVCPDKTFYPYPEAYFLAGYLVIILFSILSCIALGVFCGRHYNQKLKDNLKLIQV